MSMTICLLISVLPFTVTSTCKSWLNTPSYSRAFAKVICPLASMANLLSGSTRAKVALGSFALTVAIRGPSSANSLTNIVASESVMSSALVQSASASVQSKI